MKGDIIKWVMTRNEHFFFAHGRSLVGNDKRKYVKLDNFRIWENPFTTWTTFSAVASAKASLCISATDGVLREPSYNLNRIKCVCRPNV